MCSAYRGCGRLRPLVTDLQGNRPSAAVSRTVSGFWLPRRFESLPLLLLAWIQRDERHRGRLVEQPEFRRDRSGPLPAAQAFPAFFTAQIRATEPRTILSPRASRRRIGEPRHCALIGLFEITSVRPRDRRDQRLLFGGPALSVTGNVLFTWPSPRSPCSSSERWSLRPPYSAPRRPCSSASRCRTRGTRGAAEPADAGGTGRSETVGVTGGRARPPTPQRSRLRT